MIETHFKMKVGAQFQMGRVTCTITALSGFGGIPHYGFTYVTDEGEYQAGWMPAFFVETFTGHLWGRETLND